MSDLRVGSGRHRHRFHQARLLYEVRGAVDPGGVAAAIGPATGGGAGSAGGNAQTPVVAELEPGVVSDLPRMTIRVDEDA